jgi:hypothetical protein
MTKGQGQAEDSGEEMGKGPGNHGQEFVERQEVEGACFTGAKP